MNTSKVTRIEVINNTRTLEEGGGRVYVYWDTKNQSNIELSLQDDGRTLKVFITPYKQSEEGSLLEIEQKWNIDGVPQPIKLNVTNTPSDGTHMLDVVEGTDNHFVID